MPRKVDAEDLQVRTESDLANDPLAGVTITIADGDTTAPLAEQSDGIRALSVLAVLSMKQRSARIIAIDEPEIHLHAAAQRTIGASLASSSAQRCIATHSAAIVSQMNPMDIVAFGADHRAHQLPVGAPIAETEVVTRHWSARLLEPLTARCIIFVEGPADRIILHRLAVLAGLNLDRVGAVVFELDGAGFFGTAYQFFGPAGFDLPVVGMLDEDSRATWAGVIGIDPSNIEESGFFVCDPDLEGMYVKELGYQRVLEMLISASFTERQILGGCNVADVGLVTHELIVDYCRHKRRKVRAALAVSQELVNPEEQEFEAVLSLLQRVVG